MLLLSRNFTYILTCSRHHHFIAGNISTVQFAKYLGHNLAKRNSAIKFRHSNRSLNLIRRWKVTVSQENPNFSSDPVQRNDPKEHVKPDSLIAELLLKDHPAISFKHTEGEISQDLKDNPKLNHDHGDKTVLFPALENLLVSPTYGSVDLALERSHNYISSQIRERDLDLGSSGYDLFSGPDPSVPMSDVPCPGCGALLHCQDPGIPGYMPSQKFLEFLPRKLREHFCQRCFLMREHNLALNLVVPPEKYREIVSQVRKEFALVLVVVDIMDLPFSIFPRLSDLIGRKHPLYVVGNKVDQLPSDGKGYLERTKEYLLHMCNDAGLTTENPVKHTCLISAKTGYGVEELVTRLMKDWARKGDVYILGCTNVGKSSLFNMLLSSDYCRSSARHFINRATTSVWPGTTLNLLKFPIVKPAPWRLHLRAKRLLKQRSPGVEEDRLRRHNLKGNTSHPTLWGHVGQTFVDSTPPTRQLRRVDEQSSVPSYSLGGGGFKANEPKKADQLVEYDESIYAKSCWCYDTPGVINQEQIINWLSQEELSVLLTSKQIQPRSFAVKPGQVMFVSGLGRIDYAKGPATICMTVVASDKVPVHVVNYEEADDFYQQNVGQETLMLPVGNQERLNRMPSLIAKQFNITGIGLKESIADMLLSSLGWVAVTAGKGMELTLRAYTPGGIGCQLRNPPLLPYAVNLKGRRIKWNAAYQIRKSDE